MKRFGWIMMAGFVLIPTVAARAEDITVSTYYPSPRGAYQELRTTANTYLATLGGTVGIGTAASGSRLVVQGTGTTNATSSLNVTNSAASSLLFVRDDGTVGIGTPAPLSKLDVNGGVATGAYAGVNAAPANGVIVSGNVGIGTPVPAYPLDVQGKIGGKLDGGPNDGELKVSCPGDGNCYSFSVYSP